MKKLVLILLIALPVFASAQVEKKVKYDKVIATPDSVILVERVPKTRVVILDEQTWNGIWDEMRRSGQDVGYQIEFLISTMKQSSYYMKDTVRIPRQPPKK